jgi:4-azaleucine resistance transporter AzlC
VATAERSIVRATGSIAIAAAVVGASFGVFARASGVDPWLACAMSVFVFAGGAQFLVIGLIAGGSGPAAAVVAALVLNARHIPFGLSLVRVLRGSFIKRALASHVMIDESTALALAQPTTELAERAFLTMGITLFITWNIGTVVGVFAAGAIGDPAALGIDAAFPAGLLAMLAPQLRRREARAAAAAGAALALATTPFLPAGVPIMLAGVGAVAGLAFAPEAAP